MSKLGRSAVATILLLVSLSWCLALGLHAQDGPEPFRGKRGTIERTSDHEFEPASDLPRDYWVTVSGSEEGQTYQDLSIPEGFFGWGCEGFNGRVDFRGVPLDRTATGNVDTILERSADPVRLRDPVGTVATVDLVLTDLRLVSIEPITVICDEGPQTFDVHVSLSPEPAPTGWLTATKTHENGGTFDSTIYLYPLLTFTNVDYPEDIYVLDTADTLDPVDLTATDIPFVHEPGDAVRSLYGDKGIESAGHGSVSKQFFPGFGQSTDDLRTGKRVSGLPSRIRFTPPGPPPPPPRTAPHHAPGHEHCVEPPVGACCYSNGACAELTDAECGNSGGIFVGGDCSPNPCPVCNNCHNLAGTLYECHHWASDPNGTACSTTECIGNVLNTDTCDHHPGNTGNSVCKNGTQTAAMVVQTIYTHACPSQTVNWTTWHTIYYDDNLASCPSVVLQKACETTGCGSTVVRGPFDRGTKKTCK